MGTASSWAELTPHASPLASTVATASAAMRTARPHRLPTTGMMPVSTRLVVRKTSHGASVHDTARGFTRARCGLSYPVPSAHPRKARASDLSRSVTCRRTVDPWYDQGMAGEPRHKGVGVLGVVKGLKANPRAAATVPRDLSHYLSDVILPTAWYPEREYNV